MRSRHRPRRTTAAIIHAAVALAILATLVAAPTAALPAPRPPHPSPTAPGQPTAPSPPAPQPPAPAPPQVAPSPPANEKPRDDHLIDSILGKQARLPGEQPLSHYDIGYSSGGLFGSFNPSAIMGWLTDIIFTISRWMTAFALWAINYALGFGVAAFLIDPAAKVAAGYQRAINHLELGWVFLVLAIAYAGWHALRGRAAHGLGEAAVSFLIATTLAAILAAPASLLLSKDGMLGRTSDLSLAMSGIALDPQNADRRHGQAVSAPMQAKLQHTLIGVPHQLLNWGRVLEGPSADPKCATKYQDLLARGPWGDSDTPRNEMNDAGCGKLADFNKKGTPNRLIAAGIVQIAATLACCLLALMAFTVIGAQILLALLACFAPLALAAGILPGTGRQILIRWATAVLRALAGLVMSVAALSVIIMLASAALHSDADMPLIVRMGLLDVFLVVAFVFRKRLLEAGRRTAVNLGRRLEQTRVAGNQGRGLMPTGSALAAAEAWGSRHQRGLGTRARSELRQIAHGRWSDRRFARTVGRAANAASPSGRPANSPTQSLRTRLAHSRTARTAKFAAKATGMVLASTVGAPVYLPRASKAAKAGAKAKSAAVRTRLTRAKSTTTEFGREYARGATAPARLAARIAQRNHRKPPGTDPRKPSHQTPTPGPADPQQPATRPGQPEHPTKPKRTRTVGPETANTATAQAAEPKQQTPQPAASKTKTPDQAEQRPQRDARKAGRARKGRPAVKRTSRRTPSPPETDGESGQDR